MVTSPLLIQRSKVHICILGAASLLSTGLPAETPSELDSILFEAFPIPESDEVVPMFPPAVLHTATDITIDTEPPQALRVNGTRLLELQQEVDTVQRQQGVNSEALLNPLLELGKAQQQLSLHEQALETLEQAVFISRMHYGFEDTSQIPLVEAMVDSHLALDEGNLARQRQSMLAGLMRENPDFGSDSMGRILEKLGDWNMQEFEKAWRPEGREDTPFFRLTSDPDPETLAFGSLYSARWDYLNGIQWYRRNYDDSHPALPRLESKYIESMFLGAHRRSISEDRDFFIGVRVHRFGSRVRHYPVTNSHPVYSQGQEAWHRLYSYQVLGQTSTLGELTDTLLQQGDWELLFRKPERAAERYQEVYEFLLGQEIPEAVIESYLQPDVPVRLPDFTVLPHSRERLTVPGNQDVAYDGYIDVSFQLSASGRTSHFRVLETSENATSAIRKRLLRLIRTHPHRPRLKQGKPIENDEFNLRYYFARM